MNTYERPCAECGQPFSTTSARAHKRYCGTACRSAAWRHRRLTRTLAAVAAPTLDQDALLALDLAWRLGIASSTEDAQADLQGLTEDEARSILRGAVVLLNAAIDRPAALPEALEAAGLLDD